jgi:hypothetical protein
MKPITKKYHSKDLNNARKMRYDCAKQNYGDKKMKTNKGVLDLIRGKQIELRGTKIKESSSVKSHIPFSSNRYPKGKERCPYCFNLIKKNNFKEHIEICWHKKKQRGKNGI